MSETKYTIEHVQEKEGMEYYAVMIDGLCFDTYPDEDSAHMMKSLIETAKEIHNEIQQYIEALPQVYRIDQLEAYIKWYESDDIIEILKRVVRP